MPAAFAIGAIAVMHPGRFVDRLIVVCFMAGACGVDEA